MSKVVHLSQAAHARAKKFCTKQGMSMSDWVASLIDQAVRGDCPVHAASPPAPPVEAARPRQEPETFAEARSMVDQARHRAPPVAEPPVPQRDEADELSHIYSAPPFWDRDRDHRAKANELPV